MPDLSDPNAFLTPAEVAAIFRVDPKTVNRWVRTGKLAALRTLGGHCRFRAGDVMQAFDAVQVRPPVT